MEQSPATRRLTRGESEDSPVEFVVVDSDVSMSDAGLSSPEKKPKKKRSGLSFKKLRTNAQKLIPKRGRKDSSAKSSETSSLGGDSGVVSGGTDELLPATPSPPPPASPTATETSIETVLKSTESLPAIKEDPIREAALLGARSDEDMLMEGKDKQRQKKTRKPSRAASFMKKLAGRSKSSKVAPNPTQSTSGASEGDELSSGTLETPLSIKRQTPEGAMFVSDNELYQDGDRDDGTSVDPPSPVLVRQLDSEPTTLRAKRTEMKITLTRNLAKPSTIETSLDDEDTDANGIRSNGGDQSNGLTITRNDVSENRELTFDSKPINSDSGAVPSPRASIGIEQSPQLIAAVRTQQSSSSTSSVDARLSSLLTGDYIAEINKFSIENITNASAGSVGASAGAGGGGVEVPPLPQPRASLSIRERFFQQPLVTLTGNAELVANFDSQDVAPPSSVVVDEEIDGFMRKAKAASSATGSGGTARSKGGSKSPATVDKPAAGVASEQQQDLSPSSSSSSTSASKAASTVRTQEAAKPYQLGNSLKNPNNSGFKSIEQQRDLQQSDQQQQQDPVPANVGADSKGDVEKQGEEQRSDTIPTEPTIVFDIGTQVRPDRTSSIVKPAGGRSVAVTLAVPSTALESGAQSGTFASIGSTSRSLDELIGVGGSYDDNSQNNTSEGSLRRIAYVEQPTFYTPEEEELLTGKPPRSSSSLLSSALESGEYSLESEDFLERKMSPHGDLLLEKGASDQ
uniref:Uncharacterized protein n=1 Tax=Anopheles maculatus TaxID=74869 RepID=A0A182TCI7_9DIPT